jgi:cyclopropane fatty-acyl-phospholipid synthase-like methyltransferase
MPHAATFLALLAASAAPPLRDPDKYRSIVYVPTPMKVVRKMLELAEVKKTDVVYSLGCGDGRFLVEAARAYGARGVGIDIDPARVRDSLANVKKHGLEGRVRIVLGDALKARDLDRATVVTLYMLPRFMAKFEPLARRLEPGTRIVAHDFPFPRWKPDAAVEHRGSGRVHTLYLYRVK